MIWKETRFFSWMAITHGAHEVSILECAAIFNTCMFKWVKIVICKHNAHTVLYQITIELHNYENKWNHAQTGGISGNKITVLPARSCCMLWCNKGGCCATVLRVIVSAPTPWVLWAYYIMPKVKYCQYIVFTISFFKIGDLVYGRLSVANKDMEAELVCTDTNDKANGMGPLKDGFLFTHSLGLTRK